MWPQAAFQVCLGHRDPPACERQTVLSFPPLSSLLGYLGLDGFHKGDSSFCLYLKDSMLGAEFPWPPILDKIPFF